MRSTAFALIAAATPCAPAANVWNGPLITYSQPTPDPTQAANQDRLTSLVWLTRGVENGIYNAKTETGFTHFFSPADTEWADGTTANYSSLSYTDWNTWAKNIHGGPPGTVAVNAVLHLISDDIYLDLKFTSWAVSGGGFSYQRSTPAVVSPTPSVTISSPSAGAVFAAPANVKLVANANVSSGSVTNVAFFANTNPLGSVQSAPFTTTANNLGAGAYALTAVATAAGVSATSSVVNITVVAPVTILSSAPAVINNQFTFTFSANPGLSYLVQNSSNLVDWVPVLTNIAASNPERYSESFNPNGSRYYRVGRLPNP